MLSWERFQRFGKGKAKDATTERIVRQRRGMQVGKREVGKGKRVLKGGRGTSPLSQVGGAMLDPLYDTGGQIAGGGWGGDSGRGEKKGSKEGTWINLDP